MKAWPSGGPPVTFPTMPMHDPLLTATEHHRAGRLDEAATLYRRVLIADPANHNALHLQGVVRWRQGGDTAAVVATIRRAIHLYPGFDAPYLNLGNVLRAMGQDGAAAECFEEGLRAVPAADALRELFCSLTQDLALTAARRGDAEAARFWCRRCFARLADAPANGRGLYDLFERLAQIAILADDRPLAVATIRQRHRLDFPGLPDEQIDTFAVDLHGFADWCAAAGLASVQWQAEAQPIPDTLAADRPDYLRHWIEALPALGERPVGVTVDAAVEIVQGFYVKDNYESFVLAGRRDLLCEDKENVVRSPVVPLVAVPPGAPGAVFRVPRPHYRIVDIADPAIFVPSTPNYWHFMVEVLPMLMACDRVPATRGLPIVLYDVRAYQREMLELAGIAPSRVSDIRTIVGAETVRLHYRFARAAVPSQIPYPVAVRWLRDTFLPQVRPGTDRPRRVFLSRRSSFPKHRIANDEAVAERLGRRGFTVVLPERLGVLETVELVAGAEIVVSPIGAGTANHVFLPPRGTWIHLNNPDFFHPASPWNGQMATQSTLVGRSRHLTGAFVGDPAGFATRLVDRLEIPIDIDLDALDRLVDEAEAWAAGNGAT